MSDVNKAPVAEEQPNNQLADADQANQNSEQDGEQGSQVADKPRANFFVRCLKRLGRFCGDTLLYGFCGTVTGSSVISACW